MFFILLLLKVIKYYDFSYIDTFFTEPYDILASYTGYVRVYVDS